MAKSRLEDKIIEARRVVAEFGLAALHTKFPYLKRITDLEEFAQTLARFGELPTLKKLGRKKCPRCEKWFERPIFRGQGYCPDCWRAYDTNRKLHLRQTGKAPDPNRILAEFNLPPLTQEQIDAMRNENLD